MTISYNWLCDYLPEAIEPARLSKILTAVGLEVESLTKYESVKGGLEGLVIGEVLEAIQHPNADKLKLTRVNIGTGEPLKIVCGAPNVTAGQKVVVAPVGTRIFPLNGEPITMKTAKIRGEESQGMICAEDEIGVGLSHDGIIVLPETAVPGAPATTFFKPYSDHIFEIGLTPNRMDAMSHYGVARDVCAYLTHHNKKETKPKFLSVNNFKPDNNQAPVQVTIENQTDCLRYAGVTISGVAVKESPQWLKDKLVAIGQRPINNIVDITNFILHESGQPLHAFDLSAVQGNKIVVRNLPEGSLFVTLDEKERKLSAEDLVICNDAEGMCLAGVFGGQHSGVTEATTAIFLESAWFNPTAIRKTSFRHNLRTEAASRFEKGVDISAVVTVLKRAALLIKEVAGGSISSEVVDVYPQPKEKTQVGIKYHYLKKLSGKNYHPDAVKKILTALGFEIIKEGLDELWVSVPYSKPDISLPADIVEEVLRIDGLDNIEIHGSLSFTPAIDTSQPREALREKIAQYLVGRGFNEVVTNSITNSKYFTETVLATSVKMINNLSADLDLLRPSMVETGLETIAWNQNRKNSHLQLFEFGKTYSINEKGGYNEVQHLALYLTGKPTGDNWRSKPNPADLFAAKGLALALLQLCGIAAPRFEQGTSHGSLQVNHAGQWLLTITEVTKNQLQAFGIRQPVFIIDVNWNHLVKQVENQAITYREVPRFPTVERDLALVVDSTLPYQAIQDTVTNANLPKLKSVQLFDVFESEKLGEGKKSLAVSFTFLDEEKTLTDAETDSMVNKLIEAFQQQLGASIRM